MIKNSGYSLHQLLIAIILIFITSIGESQPNSSSDTKQENNTTKSMDKNETTVNEAKVVS